MLGDIQTIGHLVNGVFDVKNPFLVEVQYDLTVLGVVRYVAVGIHLFNGELQRLGHQILNRGGKIHRRAHIWGFWWDKGTHDLRERYIKVHVDAQQTDDTMVTVSNGDSF